jgi:molecular chaperone IbpA
VRVDAADMQDGLLSIELVREIPDAMKPRKVEINAGGARTIESEPQPQVETQSEAARETA